MPAHSPNRFKEPVKSEIDCANIGTVRQSDRVSQPAPHFSSQTICNHRCKFGLRNTRCASLAGREFRFAVIVGEGVPCQVALSST